MTRTAYAALLLAVSVNAFCAAPIDLAGEWEFHLDRVSEGIAASWWNKHMPDRIRLPGSLQERGFGNFPSADTPWTSNIGVKLLDDPRFAEFIHGEPFKSPFWLTPERHYVGAAWYRREIAVPAEWKGRRVLLTLERPHWQTMVWVDGEPAGARDSLGVAHRYDLTDLTKPGETRRLTIRVDNRDIVPVGLDAHSISDQTQSNWNGIVGEMVLSSAPMVDLAGIQVHPDVENKAVTVTGRIENHTGEPGSGALRLQAEAFNAPGAHRTPLRFEHLEWGADGGTFELRLEMGNAPLLWDEYQPALYRLEARLTGEGAGASRSVTFGVRELEIAEKRFVLNGRPLFLRGTLECCIFPDHGYPPTDKDEWKRIIRIAKSHGLNHFRFHSWCPPKAAFEAADEEGFYLQAEASCWARFGGGTAVDDWIYEECARMLEAYGNHPSFILMAPGNEPAGENREAFLGRLLEHLKKTDPRRFYTAGAGWPRIPENQYHIQYDTRLQRWPTLKFDQPPQTRDDYRDYVEQLEVPTISHEIGQWCVYPDLTEDSQYTGVLKAKNIEIFRELLERSGMGRLAGDFMLASGRFQVLLYKQEIEAALRTPNFAGFQLLDLHDFPGQGTAPVGVLNAYWRSKGYVSASEFNRFCNDVVPLARMDKRSFTADETFAADIDVANYGPADLRDETAFCWIRTEDGRVVGSKRIDRLTIATGGLTRIGGITLPLGDFESAAKLNLEIELAGCGAANDWDIWVYPAELNTGPPEGVAVTGRLDTALEALRDGGRVLFRPNPENVRCDTLGAFQPIFWNRITFPQQPVHTLGILCDPAHPALAGFPTDLHASWQWQDLLDSSKPIVMDDLPTSARPIVQTIDDWNLCRKLGVVFEARAAGGRLLVCSMDIVNDLDGRPAARRLRHSLLTYMAGEDFDPHVELSAASLEALFGTP